jgi:dynein heavy chain
LLPNFFDYFYDEKEKEYKYWTTLSASFEISPQHEYHEVIVPTAESQRVTFLARMLLQHSSHVMIAGPTGTGKTINSNQLITYGMG